MQAKQLRRQSGMAESTDRQDNLHRDSVVQLGPVGSDASQRAPAQLATSVR